ncbi:MAG: hypothetical protein U0350_40450 [Caldilineaceae bacterium]
MTKQATRIISILLAVTFILNTLFAGPVQVLQAAPLQQQTTPTPASTPQASVILTYNQAKTQLDATLKQIAALRKLLDRTQFDLGALGIALGGDPKKITDFVANEIAFEQYPGLLRGAQGALMSRAGNALDQAVLLHRLLTDAGYQAQILHGTLDDQAAETLVRQMFKPRKAALPLSKDIGKFKQALDALITKSGLPETDIAELRGFAARQTPIQATNWFTNTQSDAVALQKLLTANGVSLGDPSAVAQLMAEAKDYFWVEYRLSSTEKWQVVQPGFATGAPLKLKATESFKDESALPDALRQRFAVQVSLEHKVGDEIETKPLFSPLTGTTADLVGKVHTFAIIPDGIQKASDFADFTAVLQQSNFFFPALDGKLVKDGQFFDLLGNLIPPDVATSPLASVITGVTKSLGQATDALSNADKTPEAQKDTAHFLLTGLFIDYTFTAPGRETRTFRRTLLDRIGADNRAAKKWTLLHPDDPTPDLAELTTRYTFGLAPGAVPGAYLLDQLLAQLLQTKTLLASMLQGEFQPIKPDNLVKSGLKGVDTTWPGHPSLYTIFDAGANLLAASNAHTVIYRSSPGLVVYAQSQFNDQMRATIDVVNNERRAWALIGDQMVAAPTTLLATGVWETHTEGILLSPSETAARSTISLFRQAKLNATKLLVLKPTDEAKIARLQIPTSAQMGIQHELQAGNVLVLPESMPKDAAQFGWWRVDPRTGEALGVMDGGAGQSTVEYVMILINTVGSTAACLQIAGADGKLSTKDALGCGLFAIVGGATGVGAIAAGGGRGIVYVCTLIAVGGTGLGTGFGLSNDPKLDQPAFGN